MICWPVWTLGTGRSCRPVQFKAFVTDEVQCQQCLLIVLGFPFIPFLFLDEASRMVTHRMLGGIFTHVAFIIIT
jgi:hypothetical protein